MKSNTLKLFIVCILLTYINGWRPFDFYLQSIECFGKSEIAAFINCSLSDLPKQKRGLCFCFQISQTVKKPKLDFLIETIRADKENFVLANLSRIDGCQFLESRGILNIVEIIRSEFSKFSDMPKKCPVAKNSKIEVKDLILDPNNFPPYVPETDFVVNVRLFEDTTPVFEVIVKGKAARRDRRIRISLMKTK